MKEKPILFNSEMVRAILEGRKTQTRRVIKLQSLIKENGLLNSDAMTQSMWRKVYKELPESFGAKHFCPYGKVGDRLWVRETFTERGDNYIAYKADGKVYSPPSYNDKGLKLIHDDWMKWTPSIHMPRWASRITLEVVSVRVERVQDIPLQEIDAEGITHEGINKIQRQEGLSYPHALRWKLKELWNSINEKRGFGWNKNPWVWVVEFKRI